MQGNISFIGYFKELEKTREVLDDEGWLSSGDKGVLTEDGYLKITGRVKDLFKTSKGKYISPAHVVHPITIGPDELSLHVAKEYDWFKNKRDSKNRNL